jgi:hypothetical protein
MIYNILIHLHSGVRWLLLLSIILALVYAFLKYRMNKFKNRSGCIFNRLTLIFTHLQFVAGLVLYFISSKVIFAAESMKEPLLRFFLVEHIALMLVAVELITVGFIKFQKAEEQQKRHKITLIYYGIAFLLFLVSIPWPFRNLGGGWY